MDYIYRAAEDRDPFLFSSSTSAVCGYFMQEALRAGYIDIGGDIRRGDFVEPISSKGSLQRELQEERIRVELISREIAQRRILEEQVRRDVELEQATAMRPLRMERYSSVAWAPVHAEAGLDRGTHFGPEARVLDRFGPLQVPPPPFPPQPVVGRKLSLPRYWPDVSPLREITSSKPNLSGMKRKSMAVTGGSELLRPSPQEWSCALCQVSATSQQSLDEHLRGKKHKVNQEALARGKKPKAAQAPLGANKVIKAKKAVGSTSVTKATGKSLPSEGASTKGPVKNQREDKKQQTVRKTSYCCDLCKVKCNSKVMLAFHLHGKKHMAQLEESKKDANPRC